MGGAIECPTPGEASNSGLDNVADTVFYQQRIEKVGSSVTTSIDANGDKTRQNTTRHDTTQPTTVEAER